MIPVLRTAFVVALFGTTLPSPAQSDLLAKQTKPGKQAPKPESPQRLDRVLNELQTRLKVFFNYNTALVQDKQVLVNLDEFTNGNLDRQLASLLRPLGLQAEKQPGRRYLIYRLDPKPAKTAAAPTETTNPVETKSTPVQETDNRQINLLNVSGTVRAGDTNEPLPGVNVSVKGTTQGVVTDAKGAFSINVPDPGTGPSEAVLVFSFIGYRTQEMRVGNLATLSVVLTVDDRSLDEVVVVGYGTQRKSDLTGAVASISAAELKKVPLTSLDQGLQGRAPGVQVTQSTGQPGGGVSIRVRGGNSITGNNEPLYVIDGFPVFSDASASPGVNIGARTNPLAAINPNDIASIEILKDASATAIYGARGANGVVMITTKRGQSGKAKVDYEGYIGTQEVVRMLPLLNARQYAELINDARQNSNLTPFFSARQLDSLNTAGTDWQREIFRKAPMQSHQITVSGGNEQVQYALSGNHLSQEGIIINSGFKRSSIRLNIDAKATKVLKVGANFLFSQMNNRIVPTEAATIGNPGVIWSAHMYSPLISVYNPDGTYTYRNLDPAVGNPVAYANGINNRSATSRFLSSLYAELTLANGLTFRANGGIDYANTKESLYVPSNIFIGEGSKGQGTIGTMQIQSLLLENTLNYTREWGKNHRLNALAGYTVQTNTQDMVRAASQTYPTDQLGFNDLSYGTTYLAPASQVSSSKIASYLGRVNYGFKGRYLFTGTVRVDGSTRFGAGNKYGTFPSGSVAWRVIEENFMKPAERYLSDLKFRFSYGLTGNQEIGLYQSLPLLGNSATVFGNALALGIAPATIPNPDLRWETTAQVDVGVDMALFNNRIQLTADYYQKNTRDLLINITLPVSSGFGSTLKNIGQVRNTGWELGLSTVNVDKTFKWTTQFNLAGNRNEVTDLGTLTQFLRGSGLITLTNFNIVRVGESVGSFFGRIDDGIFQTQAEVDASAQKTAKPGDRRYKDVNGDGIINDNDRAIIGSSQPKLFGGLTNTFSYKGLELSVFMNFVTGNNVLNFNRFRLESLGSGSGTGSFPATANNSTNVLNRWTPTNPSQSVPRANTVYPGDILSSYQIEDGSFLRVRNLSLAYNLPASVTQKLQIRMLRVYASGQNLLTFTRYTGYDPEVSRFAQSALSAGIDFGGYPIAKLYTVGINLGL